MSKGFGYIGIKPFIFSKALLPITVPDHCLEEVFIEYKDNLRDTISSLEAKTY
jgi:hypothetical protein